MRWLERIGLAWVLRILSGLGFLDRAGAFAYRARARRFARDAHGRIRRWGVRFELNLNDNVQRTFYYTGWYERPFLEFLRRELRPSDTYVDVGAHVGIDAAFVAQLVPAGKVVAFEPAPDSAQALRSSAGRLANVEVVEAALGSENEVVELRANPKWHIDDASTRSRFGKGPVVATAQAIRFDDWASGRLGRMDVVKLDIEGGELDALRGMARSLERTRPRVLAVEMHGPHLAAAGATEEEIVALLGDLGYERERTIGENAIFRLRAAEPVPATARVERALARLARSRKLRSPQVVAVGSSFLGIAAFGLTASLVEAFTDRDWTLSGMEWPADFVTAALLVCLVPTVLLGVQSLLNAVARKRVEPARMRAERRSSSTDG